MIDNFKTGKKGAAMVPTQQLCQFRDIVPDLLHANDVCLCQLDQLG